MRTFVGRLDTCVGCPRCVWSHDPWGQNCGWMTSRTMYTYKASRRHVSAYGSSYSTSTPCYTHTTYTGASCQSVWFCEYITASIVWRISHKYRRWIYVLGYGYVYVDLTPIENRMVFHIRYIWMVSLLCESVYVVWVPFYHISPFRICHKHNLFVQYDSSYATSGHNWVKILYYNTGTLRVSFRGELSCVFWDHWNMQSIYRTRDKCNLLFLYVSADVTSD